MHYYKKNIGDYAKKAGRLTILQHGVYNLLIDSCYDRERFPTLEDAIDWVWASSKEEIEAVEFVLRKFFTEVDGYYEQGRIKEEVGKYHETAATNKRIADERWSKRKEKSTKRIHSVNEPIPNQEPITTNHKPLTKDQKHIRENSDEISTPKKPVVKIPFKKILELYHEMLPTLPKIEKLTKTREGFIRQRWIEDLPELKNWSNYFDYIQESDFLMGRCEPTNGQRVFRADLEWLTRPSNFAKVSEEKYHGV